MVKLSKDVNSFKEKIASALKAKKEIKKIKIVKKAEVKEKPRPVKHHKKHIISKPIRSAEVKPRPVKHHKKHIEHKPIHHKIQHHIKHMNKSNYKISNTNQKIDADARDLDDRRADIKKHDRHNQSQSVKTPIAHHTSIHKHNVKHHIQKHNNPENHKIEHQESNPKPAKWSFRTDKDIAMDFATKVHRTFDHLIKATILFGSQTTGEVKAGSDIDMVILIDDAAINWDLELTSWYREELAKIISEQDYGRDLHINTIRLTTWWRDLLHGDPIVLNILRHGQVLIDLAGFFNPLKALMMQGKIHATPEAVYAALQRSPQHLTRSKLAMLGAVEGVYWCMVEAAQASLITLGKLPPSPEHVTKMLHENFVETGILKSEYVKWYRDIYILHKQIAHGEIKHVDAKEIEAWQNRAEDFMKTLVNVIDKLIDARNAQK